MDERRRWSRLSGGSRLRLFHIPNLTGWCPLTLMDVGTLGNYYNQQVLLPLRPPLCESTMRLEFSATCSRKH